MTNFLGGIPYQTIAQQGPLMMQAFFGVGIILITLIIITIMFSIAARRRRQRRRYDDYR